jgi:hypothetical protein
MPMLHLKTFMIMAHLLGLTIGLGGATILDIILCRLAIRGRAIQQTDADLVHVISQLVSFALVALWISGIGFLIQYWNETPELLANPKLYAKIAVVVVLTINGMVLHARVLPLLYRKVGRPLFDGLLAKEQFLMIACGAISIMSWYTPFFLGIAREMNRVVPASMILAVYAGLVVMAIAAGQLLAPALLRLSARRVTASADPSHGVAFQRLVAAVVEHGAEALSGALTAGVRPPHVQPDDVLGAYRQEVRSRVSRLRPSDFADLLVGDAPAFNTVAGPGEPERRFG